MCRTSFFTARPARGKTTVAEIIAQRTNRTLRKLNATTASTADIRAIIEELNGFTGLSGVLLYLDEIQYFNKKQQQSLLEFIEDGRITLIASTTENPYFAIFGAVLSRSTVFEFRAVSPKAMRPALERAFALAYGGTEKVPPVEEGVIDYLCAASGGDVRKAVNAAELLSSVSPERVTLADAETVAQRSAMRYDRDGDAHYDILSALQNPFAAPTRTPPYTISPGFSRRGTCFRVPPPDGDRGGGYRPGLPAGHTHR